MSCWQLLPITIMCLSPLALASCSNSSSELSMLGAAYASPSGNERAAFSMVVPSDSELHWEGRRQRRHVICGKKSKTRPPSLSFEQRSLCPFSHHRNIDQDRLPVLIEEVRCLCQRPSHLSTYSQIRCQPLLYRMPVLRRNGSGLYEASTEEVTLACIPLTPKEEDEDDDFMEAAP